jgi:hypothetical protein
MAISNVLDYVQRALSMIDADNVSSISDSVEGDQVFGLLKNVYDDLLDVFPWPHLKEFMQLQVVSTKNEMKLPTECIGFKTIRYNKKPVTYIEPMEMQVILDARDITQDAVDSNGAVTDHDPQYWSTIDDDVIMFDAYDISLQASLSRIDGVRKPVPLVTDTDKPDIPERMESCLRNMLFAEALRILKADETRAATYDKKVKGQIAKLKRWARRHDRNSSWFGYDYSRKGVSAGRTVRVIEGS